MIVVTLEEPVPGQLVARATISAETNDEFAEDLARLKEAVPYTHRSYADRVWTIQEPERWNLQPLRAAVLDRKRQLKFI